MNLKKPKSFEEFLTLRKFSNSNDHDLNVENQRNSASVQNSLQMENYETNNSNDRKKSKKSKKKNLDSFGKEQKFLKSPEIKGKKFLNSSQKKPRNEELRILKLQAIEKERILEKRKKAVVLIQKIWRGFSQFVKFQAFKYVFY